MMLTNSAKVTTFVLIMTVSSPYLLGESRFYSTISPMVAEACFKAICVKTDVCMYFYACVASIIAK